MIPRWRGIPPRLAFRGAPIYRKRRVEGVPVEYTTWDELRAAAESVGLDLEEERG